VTISNECPGWTSNDAMIVAQHLAFLSSDYLSSEYKERIVDYMLPNTKPATPNPDILCNREIKFIFF